MIAQLTDGEAGMTHDDYAQLLRSARSVLERYMFDGDSVRDDIAAICMKIDDSIAYAPDVVPATEDVPGNEAEREVA